MRGHPPKARDFVSARAEGNDGAACVDWPFQKRDGYGVLMTGRPDRRRQAAHRAVLIASGQPCPGDEYEVRHLCGPPSCVNLAHLRWGTRSENQQDRFRLHGDHNRGERNPRSRLRAADVVAIRRASGFTHAELGVRFGVAKSTIGMAVAGHTWAHINAD